MANYLFQDIVKFGKAQGRTPGTRDAMDWFRDKGATITRVNINREMENKAQIQRNISTADIGKLFHYFYDPKLKKQLPYYDRFPLTFIAGIYPDGFLGINLHYLPHIYRARLMDALYSIASSGDEKSLALSYKLLKHASKFKYFKPCVKRYLNEHIRSRFLNIKSDQWDLALLLPTERFSKHGKAYVWEQSKDIISG